MKTLKIIFTLLTICILPILSTNISYYVFGQQKEVQQTQTGFSKDIEKKVLVLSIITLNKDELKYTQEQEYLIQDKTFSFITECLSVFQDKDIDFNQLLTLENIPTDCIKKGTELINKYDTEIKQILNKDQLDIYKKYNTLSIQELTTIQQEVINNVNQKSLEQIKQTQEVMENMMKSLTEEEKQNVFKQIQQEIEKI